MKLKALIASLVLFSSIPLVASLQKEVEASEINKQELFFNEHGEVAREVASQYNIYASVLLAQMALESSYGKSGLASEYNNYFGIKGSFNGKSIDMNTKEDNGSGSLYSIKSNFRVYESAKDSMIDYAELMNKERYTRSLRSVSDTYQKVTASLQGVYASDTLYADKLNGIIQKYNLTRFDDNIILPRVANNVGPNEINRFRLQVSNDLSTNMHYNSAQVYYSNSSLSFDTRERTEHIVSEGESLQNIANQYSTTVEKLMSDNGLSSTAVYKGEILVVL